MPDLDDIRAFTEVVDSGSLTRAGARLGMSKSMISRRLARLEAELGDAAAGAHHARHVADRGGQRLPALRRADGGRAAVGARRAQPAGRGDRAAAARRADVVRQLAPRAGAGRAGGAQPAARDQHLLQRPAGRPGRRGVRRGGAARQPRRLEPDRAADRADPRACWWRARPTWRAPGTPRTPADLAGHEAVPHGDQVWQFRRDGQALHPPAARPVHRRQRAGRAGRRWWRGSASR